MAIKHVYRGPSIIVTHQNNRPYELKIRNLTKRYFSSYIAQAFFHLEILLDLVLTKPEFLAKIKKQIIEIEVNPADMNRLLECQNKIYGHIRKGQDIPIKIAKEYFSYISNKAAGDKEMFRKELHLIKHYSIDHFIQMKDYNFSDKNKKSFKNKNLKFNLPSLINYTLNSFNDITFKRNKEYVIITSYRAINDYFSHFKGNTVNVFSTYKRIIISGYIAYKFEFSLSGEIDDLNKREEPINTMLHQAVKYYSNKLKKKTTK